MTTPLLLLGGLFVGALLTIIIYKVLYRGTSTLADQAAEQKRSLEQECTSLRATVVEAQMEQGVMQERLVAQQQSVERLEKERGELEAKLVAEREQLQRTQLDRVALQEQLSAAQSRIKELSEQAEEITKRQREEFKNLATEILEQKSQQFKETNRDSLEVLLKPFKDNITEFRKRVEEVYDTESKQRFSLQEEVKKLSELNLQMSKETNNLTAALKGNSKVQGDWGEMILETMLESSNLIKGVHYQTQLNLKEQESGANLRPDVVLTLPEGKQIVIDSKVSLTAYIAYSEAEDEQLGAQALKEHLASVRRHVDELAAKNYQDLLGSATSPDFVIMFVPNEPAFLLALKGEGDLWSYAYKKRVVISSPTNLFALLKIVDDLWKRDAQSKNALQIAEAGANLYDKFMTFAETLQGVGKDLSSATDKYQKAIGQLKEGKGNLVGRVEKLRELGVKAKKSLPAVLADYDEEEKSC